MSELSPEQQIKLRNLEVVLGRAVRNFDIEPHDYWPIFYIARQGLLDEWRTERLAELPPQADETIPPLLFVEVEVIKPVCVSTICKDKHTGFQDEDTLAGEITYVTDWPKTPGGRWTEQGTYYE